jgi:hypothetical protein
MITRNDILASIRHESDVCKHLFSKLPLESMEYRPTPGQRSTIELLRYLAVIGIAGTRSMIEKDWSIFGGYKERVAAMTAEEFPAMMDLQMQEIEEYIGALSDEEFETGTMRPPTGGEIPIDLGLVNSVLKWLTAYKMQIFLYAKSNGRDDISTINVWAGIDAPPKQKPVEAPAEESAA